MNNTRFMPHRLQGPADRLWLQAGLWLLLLVLLMPAARAERRVALIIGNSAYAESPLKNPVNDARDMHEQLLRLGFDKNDIVYREDLKTSQIGDLLREWRRKLAAGSDTVALVFYAGHGVQIHGENYLPAVDARIEGEDDVPQQAVKLAAVLGVMEENRTRLNLVFLDACRNNPYARSFRDGSRGLTREKLPSGTLIAYATRPGSVAADGNGRNGVFTGQLLQNMNTPGLSVEQMIKRVVRGVRNSTSDKQDPWTEGSIDEDFYFTAAAAAAAATAPDSAPKPVAPPAPQPFVPAPLRPKPGQIIKDCDICPNLIVLPRGSFMMGSAPTDPTHASDELPLHHVTIDYDLAVGRHEITQGQWTAVMGINPSSFTGCGDNCPVENVSWNDAHEYLRRLNARSGQRYRLLSEAEWEYAARAGTTTQFQTGPTITTQQANFDGSATFSGNTRGIYRATPMVVGSFFPNAFGLHDMHGNVWEWVRDVYHPSYAAAPANGSARENGDPSHRVLRGGSWVNPPWFLRSAGRSGQSPDARGSGVGFRIARTF